MIELPESYVLSEQLYRTLFGKTIKSVVANFHPHGFAWYSGDPSLYDEKLRGKKITGTAPYGGRPEIWAEDMRISFCDGVRTRYHEKGDKLPEKHQLFVEFDDNTAMTCSIQMYGGIFVFKDGTEDNWYYTVSKEKPSPFSSEFDENYFQNLFKNVKPTISVKAFLATEQRIPGLGNGVLHDILLNAKINPRTKLQNLTESEIEEMFVSVKTTLEEMRKGGGRDTEKDFFGNIGGYKTLLSSKTFKTFCQKCGGGIAREAYLGGNVYYCPDCQPIKK